MDLASREGQEEADHQGIRSAAWAFLAELLRDQHTDERLQAEAETFCPEGN
jgi:hypothetical protein